MRSLSRWLLLLILNGYILYSIIGLIAYVVITLAEDKYSPWQTIHFGEFTFHRETKNNASLYYV